MIVSMTRVFLSFIASYFLCPPVNHPLRFSGTLSMPQLMLTFVLFSFEILCLPGMREFPLSRPPNQSIFNNFFIYNTSECVREMVLPSLPIGLLPPSSPMIWVLFSLPGTWPAKLSPLVAYNLSLLSVPTHPGHPCFCLSPPWL